MTISRPRRFRFAAALAVSVAAGAAAVVATAAPAFAGDEYTAASFTGGYVDPPAPPATGTDTGLLISTGQDDATKEVALPFEFPFFGRLATKVSVCTNGWLAFGSTTSVESNNATLPTAAAPNGIVAALWDDLTTGTTGSVRTFTTGTAPNRVFVVAWLHVDTFSPASTDDLAFEVKLHETTGVIEVAYATTGAWGGLTYTAGIEDPAGAVAFGAGSLGNGNSGQPVFDWRFTPKAVAVSGTLLRDRPVASATGLGPATQTGLPIAGIDVVLTREDTAEPAARARTAADGTFTATLLGADAPATFAAEIFASGEECRVVNATGVVHHLSFATNVGAVADSSVGTYTLGAAVDATNNAIRKAVNVQQAARRGLAWARDAAAFSIAGTVPALLPETFANFDIKFVAGAAAAGNRTTYTPLSVVPANPTANPPTPAITTPARAEIHDAADNPDPWDDDVVLRVCGEHVLATISVHPGQTPTPSWDQQSGAALAWSTGFAHWFACVVQDRATFIDTKTATTATVFDLENATPAPRKGLDVTGAVACSLWDLVDPRNESWDEYDGTTSGPLSTAFEVFRAVDISMDAPPAGKTFDANSFFDVWRAAAPGTTAEREATSRIWIRHGLFADDAREANDHAGEESPISGTQKVAGLVLSRFNEDRYSIVFAPAADAVLTVALSQTTATDLDVEVLDASDQRVAFATSVGAASKSVVTAATALAVPAGAYKVRVAWRSGVASAYTLSFYEPLRIDTLTLPAWTANRPYKVDLVASGGVAPYSFATTASIPGIAVTNLGVRLVGTPTTAGDYPVHVVVTDASGSGAKAVRDFVLTIHRVLRLPPFFGITAGRSVQADVGSGGTDPVWTPVSGGNGALTLTGGATLRLSGDAGAPRTFTVSGSATEATGAVVTAGTSQVVVCSPLPGTGSAVIAEGSHFGFWFDAVAGSRTDLRFAFRGVGARPTLVAIVHENGDAANLKDHVHESGRAIRASGVRLPTSGRWFAIFEQDTSPIRGRLTVRGRLSPPRDAHGIVVIEEPTDVVPVTFEAVAGSRLRISVLRAQVPRAMTPGTPSLRTPSDTAVPLPPAHVLPRGAGRIIVVRAPAGASGTYTLRVVGDTTRIGPVFWRVQITPPARRAFELY